MKAPEKKVFNKVLPLLQTKMDTMCGVREKTKRDIFREVPQLQFNKKKTILR